MSQLESLMIADLEAKARLRGALADMLTYLGNPKRDEYLEGSAGQESYELAVFACDQAKRVLRETGV